MLEVLDRALVDICKNDALLCAVCEHVFSTFEVKGIPLSRAYDSFTVILYRPSQRSPLFRLNR